MRPSYQRGFTPCIEAGWQDKFAIFEKTKPKNFRQRPWDGELIENNALNQFMTRLNLLSGDAAAALAMAKSRMMICLDR
jgi:hypothetical protein